MKKMFCGYTPTPKEEVMYLLRVQASDGSLQESSILESLKTKLNKMDTLRFFEADKLSAVECERLAEALVGNTSLRTISIANCRIGDEGIDVLSHGLQSTKIQHVVLIDNGITALGMRSITLFLKQLQSLTIMENPIEDLGTQIIIDFLRQCELDDIRETQVIERAQKLTKDPETQPIISSSRPPLLKLALSKCCMTDRGLAAICDWLFDLNKDLKHLDITGNPYSSSYLQRVFQLAMKFRPSVGFECDCDVEEPAPVVLKK